MSLPSKRISGVRLKPEDMKDVERYADLENRSVIGQCRQLIEEALRARKYCADAAVKHAEKATPGRA